MKKERLTVHCQFGRERFDVHADSAIANMFADEFGTAENEKPAAIVFRIERGRLTSGREPPGSVRFDDGDQSCVLFENRQCMFRIRFGKPIEVDVTLYRSIRMRALMKWPTLFQRCMTRKFNSADEQEYGYLVYKAVLWLLFLSALRAGRTFLHASGFERDGESYLLCGSGGVGKTSLSAMIFRGKGSRFVSDDIVSVDREARAYANGMFVHAYPYNNLENSLPFDRHGAFISMIDRCHWTVRKKLFGGKGACRRLSPFVVYSCEPGSHDGSRLAAIVWLTRDGSRERRFEHIDPVRFADSHLLVLKDEMQSAFNFVSAAKAAGWRAEEVGFAGDLDEVVRTSLLAIAQHAPVYEFNVMTGCNASVNADCLLDMLGTHGIAEKPLR